jgi:hypothetical protein
MVIMIWYPAFMRGSPDEDERCGSTTTYLQLNENKKEKSKR